MKDDTIKLVGTHPIAAPPASVWEILLDPLQLREAMPDCEKLIYLGENRYWGVLNVHAGLVQSRFEGKIAVEHVEPEVGYSLAAEGHSAEGCLVGNGRLWLEAEGQTTLLHYEGTLEVEGLVAEAGTRYLETAARAIIRQNLTGIARLAVGEEEETAVVSPQESSKSRLRRLLPIFLLGFLAAFATLLTGGLLLFQRFYRRWVQHLAREVAAILNTPDQP